MPSGAEVVAHRGASAYAPEHTFAAYDLALEMGADVLELDVRATRDGRLVVLHDRTLGRTVGDPRPIAAVAFAELAGDRRPPALDEVLERYGQATRWLVELKDPYPALEQATVRAITSHGLVGRTTVQSFDHPALRRVRRLERGLEVAPLFCESATPSQLLAGIRRASRYAGGVGLPHRACSGAVVQAALVRGLRVRAFTVDAAADMSRLIGLGADGLITDHPDRARAAVAAGAALVTAA